MGEARQGVADLAEVAAGVDLVRVEVADHLDVVRREELERAEHLAAAQTHKHTNKQTLKHANVIRDTPTRRRRSRHAAAAARPTLVRMCGLGWLLFCVGLLPRGVKSAPRE